MSIPNQPSDLTGSIWRKLGWGTAVALLILPFVAMQFTGEVNWSPGDFLFAALMFGTVGLLLELAVRASPDWSFRGGIALAVLAGFVLIWSNLAVGILGNEENDANLLFFLVPLVAIAGSALARFRPGGMAVAMVCAGLMLLAVPVIAYTLRIGDAASLTRFDYPVFLALFALMWFGSAALLRSADRPQPSS
jgi:hypothetical protein